MNNKVLSRLNKININHNISNLINNDINEVIKKIDKKNQELIKILAKNGLISDIKKIQASTKNIPKQNQLMETLVKENDIIIKVEGENYE